MMFPTFYPVKKHTTSGGGGTNANLLVKCTLVFTRDKVRMTDTEMPSYNI